MAKSDSGSDELFSASDEEPYVLQTSSGGSDLESDCESEAYQTSNVDLISMLHKRPREPSTSSVTEDGRTCKSGHGFQAGVVGHKIAKLSTPLPTQHKRGCSKANPSTPQLSTPLSVKENQQKRGYGEMTPSTSRLSTPLSGQENQQKRGCGHNGEMMSHGTPQLSTHLSGKENLRKRGHVPQRTT